MTQVKKDTRESLARELAEEWYADARASAIEGGCGSLLSEWYPGEADAFMEKAYDFVDRCIALGRLDDQWGPL